MILGKKTKKQPKDFKALTVYCGSWYGSDPKYKNIAIRMGQELSKHKITLVYGGGLFGMMGVMAKTLYDLGGKLVPVTMKQIIRFERSDQFTNDQTGPALAIPHTKVIIAKDLNSRKRYLHQKGDAICALPGSIGTFDEIYEVIVMRHIGTFNKPIVLLNFDGYYDLFQKQIEAIVAAGFVGPEVFDCYRMVETPEAVIPAIQQMLSDGK